MPYNQKPYYIPKIKTNGKKLTDQSTHGSEKLTFPVMDFRSESSSRSLETEDTSEAESDCVEFSISGRSLKRNREEDSIGNGFPLP